MDNRTKEPKTCAEKLRIGQKLCCKPAKYLLLPLGTEGTKPICGQHARRYDTKWLEAL